jgi:hypothetical protein
MELIWIKFKLLYGVEHMENRDKRTLNLDKIRKRKFSIMTSEKALEDVVPIKWSDDVLMSKKKVDNLEINKFNPVIKFDKDTNQFEIILNEVRVYSVGATKQEAIEVMIDLLIDCTIDYFENVEHYMRIPEKSSQFPFYLRIRHCKTSDEMLRILNLV